MARTNKERDDAIDKLLARVAELESVIDNAEPVIEVNATTKQAPAIQPNSRTTERVRLRSGKIVSRVVVER